MNILGKFRNLFLVSRKRKIIGSIIIIILIMVIVRVVLGNNSVAEEVNKLNPKVQIARVYDIARDSVFLPVVGTIESQSEARLKIEASGEVSGVYKKIGDSVKSGEIILEIKNDSQRAEVLRAQANLDSANLSLSKITGNSSGNVFLILNSVRSSFITGDDVIRNKVDQFIIDGDTLNPTLIPALQDYVLGKKVEDRRLEIRYMLRDWRKEIDALDPGVTNEQLLQLVSNAQKNLEEINSFLNDVTILINDFKIGPNLSQGSIDKYKSDVSIARSNVSSSLSSLLNLYSDLSSQIGLDTKGEDILQAEASVKSAKAGLLSAQAQFEKTIVRSPISGVINSVNVSRGDFVSNFEEVSHVIGSGDVEIIAFINEEDKETVHVGSAVKIEDKYRGTVLRIAPAINPLTQNIEVRIKPEEKMPYSSGTSVQLIIEREINDYKNNDQITIPISAVKISPEGSVVYTINSENKLEEIKIKTGNILGERIIITDGLDLETIIILDARGRKSGETVEI